MYIYIERERESDRRVVVATPTSHASIRRFGGMRASRIAQQASQTRNIYYFSNSLLATILLVDFLSFSNLFHESESALGLRGKSAGRN